MCWDSIYWPRILGAQASTFNPQPQESANFKLDHFGGYWTDELRVEFEALGATVSDATNQATT